MKTPLVSAALALLLFVLTPGAAPARSSTCQATRAIFYSSSDWWRLTQGLAADPSSCAQYYISIDPLTANKTQMRPNAAWQVDAQGPDFHAMAEVNWAAWANWVASTGNSWLDAGQAARASMDAAGFNVASGDTWAVNEFPAAVRTNSGGARQDAEQFVQGLYEGSGSDPPAQGVVFMIGVGQNGVSFSQYKATLESWFQDSTFWTTMSTYVSDFFYEVYGDVRDYAIAGADPGTRVSLLNAFLQHPLALATAANAPPSDAAARSFLSAAYGPLANASWAWSSDYGYTNVDPATMADFVSAQTDAMRAYGASGRIGFAWNPLNSQGLASGDFTTDVAGILDRLAGSIHETDGGDPTQACEATGCTASVAGGAPATGWNGFSSWTPTSAVIASAPLDIASNVVSPPLTVALETAGVLTTLPNPSTVTVSSSSPSGSFATAPGGPWSPSLTLTIPAGVDNAGFYTRDSSGGTPTLSASLAGVVTTQPETVVAPAVTAPPPPPPALVSSVAFTPENDRMHVALRVVDAQGQPLQAQVALALLVGTTTVAATSGATSAQGWLGMTASQLLERGCYTVAVRSVTTSGYVWNGASPTQSDCVTALPAHVASIELDPRDGHMHLSLRVVDGAGAPLAARVGLALLVGSATVSETAGATGPTGELAVTAGAPLERGCYSVELRSLSATGYRWDGETPPARDCVRTLPDHVAGLRFARAAGHLHVSLRILDSSGAPVAARVAFTVERDGGAFAATAGATGAGGQLGLTAAARLESGCYSVRVSSVSAAGFSWDGLSPRTRYCITVARPRH